MPLVNNVFCLRMSCNWFVNQSTFSDSLLLLSPPSFHYFSSSFVSHTRRLKLNSHLLHSSILIVCACSILLLLLLMSRNKTKNEKKLFGLWCWFVLAVRPPGVSRIKKQRWRRRVKLLSVIPTRRAAYLDANIITKHTRKHNRGNKTEMRRTSFLLSFFFLTSFFRLPTSFLLLWRDSYTFLRFST